MTAEGCAPGPWLSFPLGALAQGALPPLAADRGFTPGGSSWHIPPPPFTHSNLACTKIRMTAEGCAPGPWLSFPLGALAQGALPPLAADRGFTPGGSSWHIPPPPFTYSNLACTKIRMTAEGCAPGPWLSFPLGALAQGALRSRCR
jgi:hypothetical protein